MTGGSLSLSQISVRRSGRTILSIDHLTIPAGAFVGIIGTNGAGKTTLLKTITGLLTPTSGNIVFDGEEISCRKPHLLTKLGIVMVPEGRGIFPGLSVEDNLLLGAYFRYFRTKRSELRQDVERELRRFPILERRRRQLAGTLSGGEQQMLAFARGLMAKPRILLLDEPSMGLSPVMIKETFAFIVELNALGTTIVLVEQMASFALSISHRAYVIEVGSLVLQGTGEELIDNPEVKKAYLGG